MAYATLSHVQARCPARTFSATSLPSASQVAIYLDEVAGRLDSTLLAAGYQLPVPASATTTLKVLERANALGAWAEVEQAAQMSQDEDRAMRAWQSAWAEIDPEQKGPTILLDLPKSSTESFARSKTLEEAGVASGPIPYTTFDTEF